MNCDKEGENPWMGIDYSNFIHRSMFVWTQTKKQNFKSNTIHDFEIIKIDFTGILSKQDPKKEIKHESIPSNQDTQYLSEPAQDQQIVEDSTSQRSNAA